MKINAKNSAAIKTNVKIKIQRLERERESISKREIDAGGKSLSCIFSFYDRARHKANQ